MTRDVRPRDAGESTPLRVLIVCYEYPPVGGGGGRVAASVGEGLVRRGHRVRVLTSRAPGLPAEEEIAGVSVRRAFAGRQRLDRCSVPEMAAYVALQAEPARAEIARFAPDVVHVHFAVPSGAVAWYATRATRTPYVLTAHLGDVPGGVPEQTDHLFRLVKPATVPIWRDAAAVTAVATHVGALAFKAYRSQPEIILNGIDMSRVAQPTLRPAAEPVRIVWCGRIQAQKILDPRFRPFRRLPGKRGGSTSSATGRCAPTRKRSCATPA